jgi:hypothetical protein
MAAGEPSGASGADMRPMGTLDELLAALGQFNIAPDGSGPHGWGTDPFTARLHGPGFLVEIPAAAGDRAQHVAQAMVTINDDDFAFPVLLRMCRASKLRLVDPDSGRSLG